MFSRIELLHEKKVVGMHLTMSLNDNNTFILWSSFMPRRKEIVNKMSSDLYSIQLFDSAFDFRNFDPGIPFEKWAAIEVPDFYSIPEGMHALTLKEGLYAVFEHKGAASEGPKTFRYIFGTWLPASGYEIDNRPHFELLGEKYKNNESDSEEEIWIPVRIRTKQDESQRKPD